MSAHPAPHVCGRNALPLVRLYMGGGEGAKRIVYIRPEAPGLEMYTIRVSIASLKSFLQRAESIWPVPDDPTERALMNARAERDVLRLLEKMWARGLTAAACKSCAAGVLARYRLASLRGFRSAEDVPWMVKVSLLLGRDFVEAAADAVRRKVPIVGQAFHDGCRYPQNWGMARGDSWLPCGQGDNSVSWAMGASIPMPGECADD